MPAWSERVSGPLHMALACTAIALLISGPWLGMAGRLRADADWVDIGHVALGLALLPLGLLYTLLSCRGGRWRTLYPWLGGGMAAVWRDLGGLLRGRLPAAEGGGLFPLIEGLLLLALLGTAATGAMWFLSQGQPPALNWREQHVVWAWSLGALALLHCISVSLHLLDFVRN